MGTVALDGVGRWSAAAAGVYFVLRTHFWSPLVEETANEWRRIFGESVLILTDETLAPVETADFRKIVSTTEILAALGLPAYPNARQSAWRNGDYAFYLIDQTIRDYRFMFVAEYDVFPKIGDARPWIEFIRTCAAADLCAKLFSPRTPQWKWYRHLEPHYERPGGALIALAGFRPPVARAMFEARLRQAEKLRSGSTELWPQNEGIFGSELNVHPEWRFYNIAESELVKRGSLSANIPHLRSAIARHPSENAVFHPVVDIHRYMKKFGRLVRNRTNAGDYEFLRLKACEAAPELGHSKTRHLVRLIREWQPPEQAERLITAIAEAKRKAMAERRSHLEPQQPGTSPRLPPLLR